MIQPSHIQIGPLANGTWAWVVWYGGDGHPYDQEGDAPTLEAALESVKAAIARPQPLTGPVVPQAADTERQ